MAGLPTLTYVSELSGFDPVDVEKRDNLLFIASVGQTSEWNIVDVSDPTNPIEIFANNTRTTDFSEFHSQ